MLNQYAAVGIFFLLTLVFSVGAMVTAWLFRPKPPETEAKLLVYECGVDAIGRAWHRYRVNYFRYTLIFLAMDVAIVFLLPWAVNFLTLSWEAFVGIFIFLFIILIAFGYAWKKGAFEWL